MWRNRNSCASLVGMYTGTATVENSIDISQKLKIDLGACGWLSQLSIQLWFRPWSHSSWVQAPHQTLCWHLRAWSLFQILCLPLSLPLLCSYFVSPSKINKHLKIFLKSRLTIRPSNSTTGYLLKENKNTNLKKYMHPHVQGSIVCSSHDMEAT